MDTTEKHVKMLYPTVRVRTDSAGGSGTIIYSKPDASSDKYETYVLTNHHVIADNIKLTKKWNTLVQRDLQSDTLTDCNVERFEFEYESWEEGHSAYKAEICCYDKDLDLGLLKVKSSKQFEFVATMIEKDTHKENLRLFQPLYAVGCGLGHPPLQTKGELAGFSDIIDNEPYWMSTAPTIFGNSGGSVYLADSGEFIGIPSRISVVMIGFGGSAITHMSFFIPITTIYGFLSDQMYNFLFDGNYTSEQCAEMRMKKRDRDERMMAIDVSREGQKESMESTSPSSQ